MFKRCSAIDLGTPVMYAGFQANMSKLSLSRLQSSIHPFSDRLSPIVTVYSRYSGWISTLIPSVAIGSWGGGLFGASATILHSVGIMVLLWIVTIPPSSGNLSIPTSEADPPSTYMRWIRCPSISVSITIGFSCPPLPSRGEKEIFQPVEKLWV
ncbi:hypothetical protein Tco_1020876, partial [Tanacetum coccineum]